jgi:hypothetical protein
MLSLQLPLDRLTYPSSYEERESYYMQFLPSQKLEYYKNIYQTPVTNNTVSSINNIRFFDIPFNANAQTIVKKLGKYRFKVEYVLNNTQTQILFFKQDFFGVQAVIQIHLINKAYIYGSITIPTLEKDVEQMCIDLLQLKYGLPNSFIFNANETVITDVETNKIVFDNAFYPSLIYISSATQLLAVETNTSKQISKTQLLQNSEWLSRL